MVAGLVRVVQIDPGSEVVVKWEGERKVGWLDRHNKLAHTSIN